MHDTSRIANMKRIVEAKRASWGEKRGEIEGGNKNQKVVGVGGQEAEESLLGVESIMNE